jgi:hypothetical protein
MRLGARIYLITVALATGAYFAIPSGLQLPLYNAIAVSAAIVMISAALRNRPEPLTAWLLLGLGVAASAAADIVFGETQAVPSPADMLYISAYPLLGLGLSGLTPWHPAKRRSSNLVPAAAIATLVAAVCWIFLILPAADSDQVGLSTQLVAIGYPVMDLVLIGLLVRASRRGCAGCPARLLGIGLVLMLVADIAYATENFGNSYSLGGSVDALWLLSYAFLGAGLLDVRTVASGVSGVFVAPRLPQSAPASPSMKPRGGVALIETEAPVIEDFPLPRTSRRVRPGDLRFGVVVSWSGRMLFGLGTIALFFGAAWVSPEVVLLGGAYAITGLATWVVGGRGLRL